MPAQTEEVVRQSRVGKQPVSVPTGVTVKIDGQRVAVKGPKGEHAFDVHETVRVRQEGDALVVTPEPAAGKGGIKFQGLVRSLLQNAVQGVAEGYKTSLDLFGVGYRATVEGQALTLALGLSHQITYELPATVTAKVETVDSAGTKRPRVHLESHDKMALGQVASRLKSFRPPEPYKGKGVRFTGERIREKAGKAGVKA
jgi:large subunit ribosomal protein L6